MLQIGKYYQQRNGVVVGPLKEYIGRLRDEGFTFCCDAEGISNRAWREDGSFSLLKDEKSAFDITCGVQWAPLSQQPKEEIVSKEFKIEAGKYYKDREGIVLGPMVANVRTNAGLYAFEDENGDTYTKDGQYVLGVVSDADLIEEVPGALSGSVEPDSPNPYEIKPEEIVKITDDDNRPTIEEVLSAIQRGDEVIAEDEDGDFYNIYSNNSISLLLDAKNFTIKVKQPVVKYKYVFQSVHDSDPHISKDYFENEADFLDGESTENYTFFEPIISTRKEF